MKILILALALVACGGSDLPTNRPRASALTATQLAGIGKPCVFDSSCDAALVCTSLLGGAPHCAYAVPDAFDCPAAGFEDGYTMNTKTGPVLIGTTTGHFCLPTCTTAADCRNGQCCVSHAPAFGQPTPGGTCATRIPGDYRVPLSCPVP